MRRDLIYTVFTAHITAKTGITGVESHKADRKRRKGGLLPVSGDGYHGQTMSRHGGNKVHELRRIMVLGGQGA